MSYEIIVLSVILLIGLIVLIIMYGFKKDTHTTETTNIPQREIEKLEKKPLEVIKPVERNKVPTGKKFSTHKKIDPSHADEFETASTILSNTRLAGEDKEDKYFKKMLLTFHPIFDNLHIEDIRNFCKQYKVYSAKRSENSVNTGVNLEIDETQAHIDANLWLVAYKNSERYRVLPGTVVRTAFKIVNTDNSRAIGEIFRGIMLMVPSNKFEVIEPALAEKRNNILIITKLGKLGVPLGGTSRR